MTKGEKIFENIQRLAYANGMTVNELCKMAKVSRGMIGDLQHGRRNDIGRITLDKLTHVLECTDEDILSQTIRHDPIPDKPMDNRGEASIDRIVNEIKERPELRRLFRAAIKANKQQVRSTAVLLESIVDAQYNGGILTDDEE